MTILETERLRLRESVPDDAPFMFALYNSPGFLEHIGDRGIHSLEDAVAHIEKNMIGSYRDNGFGLYVVEDKTDGTPVGVCGLVSRPTLDAPDIGFAFLPEHMRKGYGYESAAAVLAWAQEDRGLSRILAIVSPANAASVSLLEKLGLRDEGMVRMTEDADPIRLFATSA
ncbi:GNAT family N-acetyltransferase [Kordiimonas marina]|uniref:GNAT family N-acetyltransferase n=1 Tax=Kordiimonas marina TaxID=2872312 RepID=UPI001FF1DCF9|nr:GNAT family N-acetyltransferase [Kordiimonas marina]MCJ9430691.1 GNAT family N-acetyltransferase [Kordiimonas marina]